MDAMRCFFIFGILAASCEQPGFDFRDCTAIDREEDDVPPPWPVAEDSAPASEGPTISGAELEFVEREDCAPAINLIVDVSDAQDDVTVSSVRASITIYTGQFGEEYSLSDELEVTREGSVFHVPMCDKNYQGARGRFVHINDAEGHGSQAFCAHTFALTASAIPEDAPGP